MEYIAPSSFEDAANRASSAPGIVRILAGGTDVLVQLRSGLVEPDLIVDIKRIPGAFDIKRESGGWRIGAAVSGAQLEEHAGVRGDWPGVTEALNLIGSTQIQSRATLAGNLCNGSPAADSVPALMAAGATVSIVGPDGQRQAPVDEIPSGPGKTSLGPGEIITSIFLPERIRPGGDAYLRFIPRTEMDIAVVGCGVNLKLDGDRVAEARVALGAVAPTVITSQQAAEALVGSKLEPEALDRMAESCSKACRPIDDRRGTIAFRVKVAGVLGRRAARIAYDRARNGQ